MSDKPDRVAAIGYGNRSRKYLQYVEEYPDQVQLAAVVDSNPLRLHEAQKKFGLDDQYCFSSIDDFFAQPLPIDGVVIGTPDHLHYGPCMAALDMGYRVLLEKPVSQTLEECEQILLRSEERQIPVTVCYVLRYHPYFKKLKSILARGDRGRLISINHTVNVGIDRTTHSYVRGLWNNSNTSTPIMLAKCCHDIDLINWYSGSRPKRVFSSGSLPWFHGKNAPKDSARRCCDCPCEESCPFSAIDLYLRRGEWTKNFTVPNGMTLHDVLWEEMRHGPYGRCVYHCDNNVADHQILSMEMENGVLVNLTMNCFTLNDGRLIELKCAFGEIVANEHSIIVTNFKTQKSEVHDFDSTNQPSLHVTADIGTMKEFIASFNHTCDEDIPSLQSAIDSHKTCFATEESRLTGRAIEL